MGIGLKKINYIKHKTMKKIITAAGNDYEVDVYANQEKNVATKHFCKKGDSLVKIMAIKPTNGIQGYLLGSNEKVEHLEEGYKKVFNYAITNLC